MNRNQYYQKHQHLQLDRNELERKYQVHQRELEDQMMWEAAMRVQGAQVAAVSAGGGGNPIVPAPFEMTFDDISNVPYIMGDPQSIADWNTFFDLPALGTPFTSVEIEGNTVKLYGGSGIKAKPGLMYDDGYRYLVSLDDPGGCIASVGGDAFSYCDLLTSVNLPACTVVYGWEDSPYEEYGGFGYCGNLSHLNMPRLQDAGDWAFADCTSSSLSLVYLPRLERAGDFCFFSLGFSSGVTLQFDLPSLKTAGYGCFSYCQYATKLNLPSLLTVADECFIGCASAISVAEFNLPSVIDLGSTVEDNFVFLGIGGKTITLTIPSALMTCNSGNPDGDIEFLQAYNTVLINPIDKNGLVMQFDSISNADSLVGDSSSVSDWNSFFLPFLTTPFTSVEIFGDSVILYGGGNLSLDYNDSWSGLFYGVSSLLALFDNSSTIVSVQNEVFVNSSLASILIPGCTLIGAPNDYGVFSDLTVKIDASNCSTFGPGAFEYCNSLSDLTIDFANTTHLDEDYFTWQCYNLPDSFINRLTNLVSASGHGCFYGCTSLASVDLPSLTTAGGACFSDCTSLTSVSLPSLATAGNDCFYGCTSLASADLPSLTTAGGACFSDCPSLASVYLPLLVTVGERFFEDCLALEAIDLSSCIDLGGSTSYDGVFSGIVGNTISLQIPTSLYTDGDILYLCFDNTVTVNGDPNFQPFSGYTGDLSLEFDNIASADVLVGDSSNVSDWNTFLALPNFSTPFIGVTIDGNTVTLTGGENIVIMPNKFYSVTSLIGIEDQGCVAYLANGCFQDSGLVSASLASLQMTDSSCFYGCTSLTSVSLPLLATAGTGCFGGCASLASVSLPLLATAGIGCFAGCPSLASVSLPSCTNLGGTVGDDNVFRNITGNTITLTVPSALMTCNSGNPDGDIGYLQANNTVTVITA